MQLDASQVEFLKRLGRSPDGQTLKLLIETVWIPESNEKLRGLTDQALLFREQGRAKMLDDLVAHLTTKAPAPPREPARRPFQMPTAGLT